ALYRLGTLLARGQPPRGGRSSRSPIFGFKAEILTWCSPTWAPPFPVLDFRINSPFSLVLPVEPSPASMDPPFATGWELTGPLASGSPSKVPFPDTAANFGPPQPTPNTTAKPNSKRARIGNLLQQFPLL